MLNADYSRELPGKVTMEVGYIGRLSRRLLMQGDVYTPLENYKDPGSGITWQQNAQTVYNLANTLAQARRRALQQRRCLGGAGGDEQSQPGAESAVRQRRLAGLQECLLSRQRVGELFL